MCDSKEFTRLKSGSPVITISYRCMWPSNLLSTCKSNINLRNFNCYLSVCLSVCLSVHPYVCLSICLSGPSIRLSVCLFVYPSVCLTVCPSICLSLKVAFGLYFSVHNYHCLTSSLRKPILTIFATCSTPSAM